MKMFPMGYILPYSTGKLTLVFLRSREDKRAGMYRIMPALHQVMRFLASGGFLAKYFRIPFRTASAMRS